jgi:hypothetical protein
MVNSAQVIQQQLKRVGLNITICNVQYAVWIKNWQAKLFHTTIDARLRDSTGPTGLASIRALRAGERAPLPLARVRPPRWAHRADERARALDDASTAQRRAGDAARPPHCQALTPGAHDALPPWEQADTRDSHRQNAPAYAAPRMLDQLTGVDGGRSPAYTPTRGTPGSHRSAWRGVRGGTSRPSVPGEGWPRPRDRGR